MHAWNLSELPLAIDLETKTVLKALPAAHAALAELKGIASTIPNQSILINTLVCKRQKIALPLKISLPHTMNYINQNSILMPSTHYKPKKFKTTFLL